MFVLVCLFPFNSAKAERIWMKIGMEYDIVRGWNRVEVGCGLADKPAPSPPFWWWGNDFHVFVKIRLMLVELSKEPSQWALESGAACYSLNHF